MRTTFGDYRTKMAKEEESFKFGNYTIIETTQQEYAPSYGEGWSKVAYTDLNGFFFQNPSSDQEMRSVPVNRNTLKESLFQLYPKPPIILTMARLKTKGIQMNSWRMKRT